MVRNMVFSFPRYRHDFAKMGVKSPQKIKSHPKNSTLSKLGEKINLSERAIPTLQQFHNGKR